MWTDDELHGVSETRTLIKPICNSEVRGEEFLDGRGVYRTSFLFLVVWVGGLNYRSVSKLATNGKCISKRILGCVGICCSLLTLRLLVPGSEQ